MPSHCADAKLVSTAEMLKEATTAAETPATGCRCNNEAQDADCTDPPSEQANMQRIKTVAPTRFRNAAPAGSAAVLIHSDVFGLILLSASSQSANGEDFCEESKGLLLRAKLVCRAWRKTARLRLKEIAGGFLRRMNSMREVAEARDVAGIIRGMQFFLGHARVQSTCCEALLALTPTPGDEEWRFIPQDEGEDEELADVMMHNVFAYLVDCGVVAALREAVRAHTDSEAVVRPALKILSLLARSEDEDVAEEVLECVAFQGGIDTVLAGLEAHQTSAEVQELGLEAIVNFGFANWLIIGVVFILVIIWSCCSLW